MMELKDFLSMNGGDGENSYAHSGHFVTKVLAKTKPCVVEAIEGLLRDVTPLKLFKAADLGCSCGPNVTVIMAEIIGAVEEMHRREDMELPEMLYLLNDLPSNDFNSVFSRLPSVLNNLVFGGSKELGALSCFVMGVPGSFHGRIFPRNDTHFVHSLYGVHWLSQVPTELMRDGKAANKGQMYISKTSPRRVWKAYLNQFEKDFCSFLKYRYEEMVSNGRMLLILHGRPNADALIDNVYPWHLLSKALSELVSQGLVEEKRVDEWNIPYYTASIEEVKDIVEREGSFVTEKLESFTVPWGEDTESDIKVNAQKQAKNIRSFTEPLLAEQFGEDAVEHLFDKLPQLIVEALSISGETDATSLIAVLKKSKKISYKACFYGLQLAFA